MVVACVVVGGVCLPQGEQHPWSWECVTAGGYTAGGTAAAAAAVLCLVASHPPTPTHRSCPAQRLSVAVLPVLVPEMSTAVTPL